MFCISFVFFRYFFRYDVSLISERTQIQKDMSEDEGCRSNRCYPTKKMGKCCCFCSCIRDKVLIAMSTLSPYAATAVMTTHPYKLFKKMGDRGQFDSKKPLVYGIRYQSCFVEKCPVRNYEYVLHGDCKI
jgi:hypothetical protein